ncbi:KGG domain-containing protein [Microvirga arsenatis]|uniref:Stress-induced protein n=1 Tax=Microvirga arsenatis TaxID=2692265 RepID=A0ABW9Z3Q8_9HYPH|nr:KGG domain-containing protein [Microvirga arsenatis]NBJ13479.1 stress-induced protein [Microvirga arsenatis]NBJ26983.1 stress-induced protein [Microvirga arsenatis]
MSTCRPGFASMDPQKQREITSQGVKSVPAERRSFSRNSDLVAQVRRKGGLTSPNVEGTR